MRRLVRDGASLRCRAVTRASVGRFAAPGRTEGLGGPRGIHGRAVRSGNCRTGRAAGRHARRPACFARSQRIRDCRPAGVGPMDGFWPPGHDADQPLAAALGIATVAAPFRARCRPRLRYAYQALLARAPGCWPSRAKEVRVAWPPPMGRVLKYGSRSNRRRPGHGWSTSTSPGGLPAGGPLICALAGRPDRIGISTSVCSGEMSVSSWMRSRIGSFSKQNAVCSRASHAAGRLARLSTRCGAVRSMVAAGHSNCCWTTRLMTTGATVESRRFAGHFRPLSGATPANSRISHPRSNCCTKRDRCAHAISRTSSRSSHTSTLEVGPGCSTA
jgi:hypothetical protein